MTSLKDSYGFIEPAGEGSEHAEQVWFHFSSVERREQLNLGDEARHVLEPSPEPKALTLTLARSRTRARALPRCATCSRPIGARARWRRSASHASPRARCPSARRLPRRAALALTLTLTRTLTRTLTHESRRFRRHGWCCATRRSTLATW